VLQDNPARIRDLVRDNHLSVDEVGREFEKQLGIICEDYEPTIRRVLSRLVSSETEGFARKWIRGTTLIAREAELLGVPPAIESAEQASAVIGAIAAIHKAIKRPFLMLVDELEHFARYDQAHDSKGNITWLKRLLEELADAGALALVAGHWSAWDTTKDYLDRFPQYAPIDLVKLEPTDITSILRTRLPALPKGFGDAQAQVIAKVTNGNMRRVMSLCNLLFRQTNGFAIAPEERQIHEAWTSVAQRISQEQALEQIVGMLEPRGFVIDAGAQFHSIPFDLVATRDDGRAILVQAKHSNNQGAHYDAARHFIDKLVSVASSAPRAVGMFLANGSIDDELLEILRGGNMRNLLWFDLTSRDAMEKIRTEISAIDGQPSSNARAASKSSSKSGSNRAPSAENDVAAASESVIEAQTALLRAQNAELEKRLQELDARRHRETQELNERLDRVSREAKSPRYDSVRDETKISPERARASYEAMLEPPSLNRKLRYLGRPLALGIVYIVIGLFLLVTRDYFFEPFAKSGHTNQILLAICILTGIALPVFGAWMIWRRYSKVADYFEFSRQAIRDLYVRDVPIEALSSVNTVLRRSIDRFGVREAHPASISLLRSMEKQLPSAVLHYFEDLDA